MLNRSSSSKTAPSGAPGYRAYAVGDVHGRLDLLEQLLARIHSELQHRPATKTLLVFVGDLIDRGPSSAHVIERLRNYRREGIQPVFLLGNHEEVLLRILRGDAQLITKWRWFGGSECLQSYGVEPEQLAHVSDEEALAIVRSAIPKKHVEFLESFADSCRFGDFLFVHAGIRPGIDLEQQSQSDLRWIREPFLLDETDHGFVVVHGHTISTEVQERPNRIGIDTGAYRTGILTALAIEGRDRWLLDTTSNSPGDPAPPTIDLSDSE
jgi:serine/threonine protein phosphatase 1